MHASHRRARRLRTSRVDVDLDHDPIRIEFAVDRAVNQGVNTPVLATVSAAYNWLEGHR